jgi:hypothetical protein
MENHHLWRTPFLGFYNDKIASFTEEQGRKQYNTLPPHLIAIRRNVKKKNANS